MPATADARKLRAEFNDAVLAAVERLGVGGLRKGPLVAGFLGKGASRTTIYRWLAEILATGAPAEHLAEKVAQAAADRAAAHPDEDEAAEAVAAEAITVLPRGARVDRAVLDGGVGEMINHLRECIKTSQQVMAYSRTSEGNVRNAKLLLSASEHLRRAIDTTARMQTVATDLMNVEAYHKALFDTLREESPATAERLLVRLQQMHLSWTLGSAG